MSVNTKNQINLAGYAYDSAGNLIAAPPTGTAYAYDAENHLISTGGQTYLYDGDGKRVEKASGSPLTANKLYWYGAETNPIIETDAAGNELFRYFRFQGLLVTREESNDWVDHYGLDALGNVRWVYGTNSGSPYIVNWDISDYYPFGGERVVEANSTNHYKFTGKERDSESGNDNFTARYYSSSLGRFISPDPDNAGASIDAPQSWNAYSYVLNNPLNAVDPDGLDCVYLNDAGTGVDGPNGIDRESNSGECGQNGGAWFDGTINSNSVRTDPNSDWVFAEGVGEATLGNNQYSCGGSTCDEGTRSAFANSIAGGSSSTTVSDTSDILSTDASTIFGDVYQRARVIADASDVAACAATGFVLGKGAIPPLANHVIVEQAAHGLENPKTATAAARAYHTATDARFTAGGKFSKVLVPRTAKAVAPVLATAGKALSVAGWVVSGYEAYEAGKECASRVK